MTALFDVVVVGGGPAGSTCARWLTRAGLRVAVVDRATFPRVKLCAGWLSDPVWDVLALSPGSYPRSLWEWHRCHVFHGGERHTIDAHGWFIRRYEFDDFLLRLAGATVVEGHSVRRLERDREGIWIVDERFRARHLVGAGGTHCPVARALFPRKRGAAIGTQERELEADPIEVAASCVGNDGEPALLLHADLGGYSWNVPKTDWLNVGCGTLHPEAVRAAWPRAREFFAANGHLPPSAATQLDRVKGHAYHLFDPTHLATCQRDGAFLVGDALGLAQPFTAEGILPAVLSGRLCAEAIVAEDPTRYRRHLETHPVFEDYRLLHQSIGLWRTLRSAGRAPRIPGLESLSGLSRSAIANAFAWLFSGRRLPGGRVAARVLRTVQSFRLGGGRDAVRETRHVS